MTQTDPTPPSATGTTATRRRGRRRRPSDGSMPLVEHIHELRSRLLVALAGIVVGTAFGFWWYGHSVLGIPSLGDVLTGPYCSVPESARVTLGDAGECRLLATGPFEQFMLRMKVGATAGVVLSSPIWLFEIWAFIVPGLHKNERRYGIVFTILAAILFLTGAVLAYVVVAQALDFLLSVGNNVQSTALSGAQYFDFIIHLILIFGVSFEIPLLIAMLNVVGVVHYEWLKKARRGIIMAIFVFAAVASPGQDPFSMLALAAAVCVLVEIAIQFARVNDKRRNRARPEWLDVDDESASPVTPSGGIGGGSGIEAPAPVSASPSPGASVGWSPQAPSAPDAPNPVAPSGPVSYDDIT